MKYDWTNGKISANSPSAKLGKHRYRVNFSNFQYRNGRALEENVDIGTHDLIVMSLKKELAVDFETHRDKWRQLGTSQLWRYNSPRFGGIHFTILANNANTKFQDVKTAVVMAGYYENSSDVVFRF